jgi:hypothetical protein
MHLSHCDLFFPLFPVISHKRVIKTVTTGFWDRKFNAVGPHVTKAAITMNGVQPPLMPCLMPSKEISKMTFILSESSL